MTRESLLDLLRTHQDGVYTVCLHVLRNPHDAEDAVQEALLKVAAEAGRLREPRALKSWLYRVVYRTAIDHLRRRETRRRIEEGSAAMPAPPLTDAQREAIHEAMSALPDDERLILVEHYFEKVTIDELSRREGISDVAMGKRLEKAREKLKRGLAGAGFLLAGSDIARALESVTLVAAPAGLIASKAFLIAAGGTAMTSTKSVGLAVILALMLLLGGTAYFLRRMEPGPAQTLAGNPSIDVPKSPTSLSDPATTQMNKVATHGDVDACRRLLSNRLINLRRTDVDNFASSAEILHSGGFAWFESLAKDFSAAAGPDFLPIVKTLLENTESGATQFILASLLGRSRLPEAVVVLTTLTGEGTDLGVIRSALYAIGVVRSPEGFSFLRSYWEQAKTKGESLEPATLTALGLFGPEAIPLLVAETKAEKSLFRDRAEYLGLLRGDDCTDALLALLRTEENDSVREGAARALAYNLSTEVLPTLLAFYDRTQDPKLKAAMLYGLGRAQRNPPLWESTLPVRMEFASKVVERSAFPSGSLSLDRALIHFSALTSTEYSETFLLKFEGLDRSSAGKDYDVLLREVLSAYSRKSGYEDRLANLMSRAGLTADQQERMRAGGLMKREQDLTPTNTKALLESIRTAKPFEPRYEIALASLSRPGPHEAEWSRAMSDAYERCATEKERLGLLDNLVTVLYGKREREVGIPQDFLAAVLTGSSSVDAKVHAAYAYLTSGLERDLAPHAVKQIADLVGHSMKWATDSSLATGEFRMVQLGPSVLGDYYARYGTEKDVEWLRKLPEEFPYPASLQRGHKVIRDELTRECRRAIDAILLRN